MHLPSAAFAALIAMLCLSPKGGWGIAATFQQVLWGKRKKWTHLQFVCSSVTSLGWEAFWFDIGLGSPCASSPGLITVCETHYIRPCHMSHRRTEDTIKHSIMIISEKNPFWRMRSITVFIHCCTVALWEQSHSKQIHRTIKPTPTSRQTHIHTHISTHIHLRQGHWICSNLFLHYVILLVFQVHCAH